MHHSIARHAHTAFSSAWYLVLVLPWALLIGLCFFTGLHDVAQPSAAAPAELAPLPPAA